MDHKKEGVTGHKLSDAVTPPTNASQHPDRTMGRPDDPQEPEHAPVKQHNADISRGHDPKDHLVDIGRGEQTKGRGPQ